MRNVCRSVILVVALGTVLATAHQAAKPLLDQAPLWVDVKNHQLKDEYGRELYFHGTNIIVKGAPWIPDRRDWSWNFSFVAKDMQLMQDLGLNAIRLGAMWPGVEPQRGQYNMTYLDELFDLVQEASTYGIRSLLDMHQDVLSEKYCGEGLPNWATIANVTNFPWPLSDKPFNTSTNGTPDPESQCHQHSWPSYYPTQEVSQAFENLYQNGFGLRDAWAAFWQTVAKRFSSAGAAVLGYELLNEPWSGDVWKNPLLMVPGVADVENLAPAYEQLQSAIRAVDTQHPIFFEGVTWDWLGVGFQKVPGGDDFRNRSVLSYHFYIPPDFSVDVQFAARKKDMQRLGCGGMLTEFGSARCNGCGTLTRDAVMDKCDEDLQSWMFWEFKQFVPITGVSAPVYFENGTLNNAFAFKFSRTYAQVVAGTTQVMKFNITTADFDLSYTTDPSVTLRETVIYASTKYHYQGGYRLIITPDVPSSQLWYNVTGDYIRVYHSEALNNQTNIGIKIRAV